MTAQSATGKGVGDASQRVKYNAADQPIPNNNRLFDQTNQHPMVVAAGKLDLGMAGAATIRIPYWGRWSVVNGVVQASEPGVAIVATYTDNFSGDIFSTWNVEASADLTDIHMDIEFNGSSNGEIYYIVSTIGVAHPVNSAPGTDEIEDNIF